MNDLIKLLEIPLFLGFIYFAMNFIHQLFLHALNSVCEKNSKWWIKNKNGVFAVVSITISLAFLCASIIIGKSE